MASRLPAFPRFVFTVFEPISLIAGFIPAVYQPDWFIAQQLPASPSALPTNSPPVVYDASSRIVSQQLGNCYGLVFLVAVAVLYSTREVRVVRNYLIALWIADIGHVALTVLALGWERAAAPGAWNATTWGNVGVTILLFLTRSAYLLGLFGDDAPDAEALGRKKLQ